MVATNPLTYNLYVQQVAAMAVVNAAETSGVWAGADPAFNTILPQMLNYAELRIQRDLDLLQSEVTDQTSYSLTPGSNQLAISVNDFVTITSIVVDGVPLLPTTRQFLQNVYGSGSTAAPPEYFANAGGDAASGGVTSTNYLLGPYPDQAYPVAITGTQRLPSLASFASAGPADSGYTFISTYLPDLLLMASMIYISAYQRNFGATANDPEMAGTYESQYQALLKGATVEEARKKFSAGGWSSATPAVVATPGAR